MKKDNLIKETNLKIFNAERVIGSVQCEECKKQRIVYVSANVINKNNIQKDIIEQVLTYCESVPYLCSLTLITNTNFLLYGKVFTRENVRYGVPIQGHYYSKLV